MTWRERIARAEQHRVCFGLIRWPRFSESDFVAWEHARTCPVGEVAARTAVGWFELNTASHNASLRSLFAMSHHNPHKLSRILDELDDAALRLKRHSQ